MEGPVSGSSASDRYPPPLRSVRAATRRSDAVQPKASMVQQAAVGADHATPGNGIHRA
jgi:hypothetical protein